MLCPGNQTWILYNKPVYSMANELSQGINSSLATELYLHLVTVSFQEVRKIDVIGLMILMASLLTTHSISFMPYYGTLI